MLGMFNVADLVSTDTSYHNPGHSVRFRAASNGRFQNNRNLEVRFIGYWAWSLLAKTQKTSTRRVLDSIFRLPIP